MNLDYIFRFFLMGCGLFILFASTAIYAAEFHSQENISIDNSGKNIYATGSKITIKGNNSRDLTVFGSDVKVTGSVERGSIILASNTDYTAQNTGQSVRLVGNTVSIKNAIIEDDLLLAGSTLIIENSNIHGDLVVAAGTLEQKNSRLNGKFYANYTEYKGDKLEEQIKGDIIRYNASTNLSLESILMNKIWEIGSILLIVLACWYLNKKNKLHIKSIRFNRIFLLDTLYGISGLVLPFLFLLISFFILSPHIGLTCGIQIYSVAYICALLLPIYLGNFIKNVFELKINVGYCIAASYIVLLSISIISTFAVGFAHFYILIYLIYLAFFGFILRKGYEILNYYLSKN